MIVESQYLRIRVVVVDNNDIIWIPTCSSSNTFDSKEVGVDNECISGSEDKVKRAFLLFYINDKLTPMYTMRILVTGIALDVQSIYNRLSLSQANVMSEKVEVNDCRVALCRLDALEFPSLAFELVVGPELDDTVRCDDDFAADIEAIRVSRFNEEFPPSRSSTCFLLR